MCILSGCDYLDNLYGIGLAKARKFMMMTEETDMKRALLKIPSYLNLKKLTITDKYINDFLKAEATFKFMFVYDPLKREMCRLNALEEGDMLENYCDNAGELLKSDIAYHLALGNLNPRTLLRMDSFDPNSDVTQRKSGKHPSIWRKEGQHSAPIFKQQSKIHSFFTNPRKHKQLVEVQNIIDQENDVSCELEIDDLVSSYIANTPPPEITSKRRNSEETDEIKSNEAKRHQIEINRTTSLMKSLPFINKFKKTQVNENHRVISRFFVRKSLPASIQELAQESESSTESNAQIEITQMNEAIAGQKQKLEEFYESMKTKEPVSIVTDEILLEREEHNASQSNETVESSTQPSDNVVDLDKYEYKVKIQKQSFINDIKPKIILQPLKIQSRRMGLSKGKASAVKIDNTMSTQARLSKFGFSKSKVP